MSKKLLLIGTVALSLSGLFASHSFAGDKQSAGKAYIVWGEWHRNSIDFYINKLNKHTSLSAKQEKAIRKLLDEEADQIVELQAANVGDLSAMLAGSIEIGFKTHDELAKIFNEDQQFLIPMIESARKESLKERVSMHVETLWYHQENAN
ncbi:hypothetical protein [Pelagicoccus mobilis]|uniref:Uncharacterized protein n=1 Tax=Pelagicoccus mobilis TaxID=415221 RepID=A0A934S0G0_9BACT|nr:hypothetical protein [Pelagicoccus mobilis]MBK1876828.1 hypothetical protein [Pelagicoccus mobilis]